MHSLALLVAAATLGVDYGWQPTDDGQLEYIIQVEPSLVNSLKQGQEIVSEIHPDAKNVRRFRILVGKGELPRVKPPEPPALEAEHEAEPDSEPEMPLERPFDRPAVMPPARPAAGARIDFKPDLDRESALDLDAASEEPADLFPRKPLRRREPDFADERPAPKSAASSRQPGSVQQEPELEPVKHRTVGHTESWQNQATVADEKEKLAAAEKTKADAEKPWFPLMVTILLLFGSLGGNAYLAWMAKDFYDRYRALSDELRGPRVVEA